MGQDASKNNLQSNRKFSRENVQDPKNNSQDSVIFILEKWCGHCITLKNSGEIEKLKSKMTVLELDEKNSKAKGYMEQVNSKGYPTIAIVKNNTINKYTGVRTASAIFDFYNKL
jgi:hypothetical protein